MKVLAILLVVGSLALCLQSHAAEKGKLTSIQGVAAKTEAKLKTAGVNSTDELLEKGGTPRGRKELAAKSGLPLQPSAHGRKPLGQRHSVD